MAAAGYLIASNHLLSLQINKRNVEARDARMTIMNELVLSIKPLKVSKGKEDPLAQLADSATPRFDSSSPGRSGGPRGPPLHETLR